MFRYLQIISKFLVHRKIKINLMIIIIYSKNIYKLSQTTKIKGMKHVTKLHGFIQMVRGFMQNIIVNNNNKLYY